MMVQHYNQHLPSFFTYWFYDFVCVKAHLTSAPIISKGRLTLRYTHWISKAEFTSEFWRSWIKWEMPDLPWKSSTREHCCSQRLGGVKMLQWKRASMEKWAPNQFLLMTHPKSKHIDDDYFSVELIDFLCIYRNRQQTVLFRFINFWFFSSIQNMQKHNR